MGGAAASDQDGYDVIGDVHGQADKLEALLYRLGYECCDGTWRHARRQAVFIGDLIDRGPRQVDTISVARSMIETGAALMVLGNHEFNAVAFNTPDSSNPGEFLRPHSTKNVMQHQSFLTQVAGGSQRDEVIAWFMTLPLWLDLGHVRFVHACWSATAMKTLVPSVGPGNSLTPELVELASRSAQPEFIAIEHLLKGPELQLPEPYRDSGGHERPNARFRWWLTSARSLRAGAHIPEGAATLTGDPYPQLPETPITPPVDPYRDAVPVIFGHYWRTGTPATLSDYGACVDFSAGKTGPLVAYRFSGEATLSHANFVSSAD